MNAITKILTCLVPLAIHAFAHAASGEMGTGVPEFGMYSDATGAEVRVWRLTNAALGFPAACASLRLTPTTMGINPYKMAVATLLTAKASGRPVRFYAHAERDGGCGVDYVEMQG
jgi:hypothetical protein